MRKTLFTFLLLAGLAASGVCAGLPDLRKQAAWGDKEKKEFLNFIRSDQPAPQGGQVKHVPDGNGARRPRKARYASLALVTDTMIIDTGGGRTKTETTTLGPKLLVGGHLFSWVRYYAGLKYNKVGQDRLDGARAHFSHIEVPAGIELALIPLGTPHTRYVLLRGGVSSHLFSGPGDKSDFNAPLKGWHPAWNLGLGYEWQFANSNWRFHSLAEGYRSMGGGLRFYGTGLTAGFVYTF